MADGTDVVIVAALRTPIGNLNGIFSSLPAHALGATVIKALLTRTGVAGADVSQVILGQVLTAQAGQNPARQASIHAGVPQEVPAWGFNQVCGSGLRAVALGWQGIRLGEDRIVIAGGQESMTQAPHTMQLRGGVKMGNATATDTMVFDALTDAFKQYHMGITAENLAEKYGITREDADAFSAQSQQKCEAARKAGRFADEIVPVDVVSRKETQTFTTDEFPRDGVTAEALGKLRPAFKPDGIVTAGNASGINDGAAAVMLMSRAEADKRGLKPLARIASWAHAGVDPSIMGIGPVPAAKKALQQAGWTADQLDLMEINEAFAAQALAVNREMGWDTTKINVNGGSIALGHPVGASGARVLVTLLHEMQRRNAQRGLASLCIGGGMGVALCVER